MSEARKSTYASTRSAARAGSWYGAVANMPPVVAPRPLQRALCYDAFAILHSGESKTAVYVAQKLNRALVLGFRAQWNAKHG